LDARKLPEYLISWHEYPGEDTWECIENLRNVQSLIDAYEAKIKQKQEEHKIARELEQQRLEKLKKKRDAKGSLDKGDVPYRIVALHKNPRTA
jgi:Chromo (CHRromatin Organisation MOdifier) domain